MGWNHRRDGSEVEGHQKQIEHLCTKPASEVSDEFTVNNPPTASTVYLGKSAPADHRWDHT